MTELQELSNKIKTDTKSPIKVCFVCTGNTCRSPMAMAVLNHISNGRYEASSAGIMAQRGAPINSKALKALKKANVTPSPTNNYSAHTATQLDMGIMEDCDKIVAVSAGHVMMIVQMFPLYASKVTAFENNITDPFGQSEEVYEKCLDEITNEVKNMFVCLGGE